MATTTAARFQPTTDSFGQLTLHAERGMRALPINFLLVVAFIAVFVFGLMGLAAFDKAVFTPSHVQPSVYEGVVLDYD
ncbi:hypothetical protein AEAC466_07845 [Asticcacaulis sp. AC466]|uniref:hypothetical protein n=1 Tax=Asticcacaulis sp. AC466 TaxID=1282362 RepID=UPI0003C3ED04|nr:hypothetical protein [Asticcacaulis sp. AC466]ESQ84265.1 hypothetical protein AEAC466_07845 [Asticcacaulis sp. AC466]